MSSYPTGEKIMKDLVEYPLPADGTSMDYIFYMVPTTFGYGQGAAAFFSKFYQKHKAFPDTATTNPKPQVSSLEEVINILYTEISDPELGSVIREIIFVNHATAKGMKFPVFMQAPTENQALYQFITTKSLIQLQTDFLSGKYADFNKKRKAVIKLLKSTSWITLRCCNFGQNQDCLYAFYSFFGGFANVYAPKVYQYFGEIPVNPNFVYHDMDTGITTTKVVRLRFRNSYFVHDHMLRQRFFPQDNHTPDRKDKIISALLDPGKYSDPFTLATKTAGDSTSTEGKTYDKLITDLDNEVLSPYLIQQFTAAEYGLTVNAVLMKVEQSVSWQMTDKLTEGTESFQVEYSITADTATSGSISITADAQMTGMYSALPSLPIQLFMNEVEHREFGGWLFFLQTYSDDPDSDPASKTTFETIKSLLDGGQFSDSSVNIKDLFTGEYTLTDAAAISLVNEATDQLPRTWRITDKVNYLVKLEENIASDTSPDAYGISAYRDFNDLDETVARYNLVADPGYGTDSDIPGVELMAYFDQFAFNDQIDLIDFLRVPYRPEDVAYLHHAQEALQRKKEFITWWENSGEKLDADVNATVNGGYSNLGLLEQEDNMNRFYAFEANDIWAEVKSSNPSATTIQQDLFTEEPLHFDDLEDVDDLPEDSPSLNISDLRKLQSQGHERNFLRDKIVIPTSPLPTPNCAAFRALLDKIKGLSTTDPDEILTQLRAYKPEGEFTFMDYATENYGFSSFKLVYELLEGFGAFEHSDIYIARLLAKFMEAHFSIFVSLFFAVGEVLLMEYAIAKADQEADEHWEREGNVVGIRQWARVLDSFALHPGYVFPDPIVLDWNTTSGQPYYLDRYRMEVEESRHYAPVAETNPDQIHTGFDEGWKEIEKIGNEVRDKAPRIFDDALLRGGATTCEINALYQAGIVNSDEVTRYVMHVLAETILKKCPEP